MILDAALLRHEKLNFHPLENVATTTIGRDDFLAFLRHAGHEPAASAGLRRRLRRRGIGKPAKTRHIRANTTS